MLAPPKELVTGPTAGCISAPFAGSTARSCALPVDSGREILIFDRQLHNFRMRCTFELEGEGKCGLALRMDDATDGYFISLDLFKGLAQARASGANPDGGMEDSYIYKSLQANYFVPKLAPRRYEFELIAYGKYVEFSLDGEVMLTFADDLYSSGYVGFYSEGAHLHVDNVVLDELDVPQSELHTQGPSGIPLHADD
jgi:beta-fructofuranosidase